jgi:hypothetical protein
VYEGNSGNIRELGTENLNPNHMESKSMMNPTGADFSPENLIFNKLFTENGPLMPVDKVWPLFGFNSRDTFNRAAQTQRIPLHVIRPEGRRKSFVATQEVSQYLATLTKSVRGEIST